MRTFFFLLLPNGVEVEMRAYTKKGGSSFEEPPCYRGKGGIRTNDYNVQYINHVWSSVKSL